MRASDYFKSENFRGVIREPILFDKIEPEDVIQGNCENSYLLATLSGIAERDMDDIVKEEHLDSIADVANETDNDKSIKSIFVTR